MKKKIIFCLMLVMIGILLGQANVTQAAYKAGCYGCNPANFQDHIPRHQSCSYWYRKSNGNAQYHLIYCCEDALIANENHTFTTTTSGCITTTTCTKCGQTSRSGSHSYVATVVTPATCIQEGTTRYTCSKCGDTYTKTISTTAHTWTNYINNGDEGHSKECSVCHTTIDNEKHRTISIMQTGSVLVKCTKCDYQTTLDRLPEEDIIANIIPGNDTFSQYLTVDNSEGTAAKEVTVKFYRHAADETQAAKGRCLTYTHTVPVGTSRTYLYANFEVSSSAVNPVQVLAYTDDKTTGTIIGVFSGGSGSQHTYLRTTDSETFKYGDSTGEWRDGATPITISFDTIIDSTVGLVAINGNVHDTYYEYLASSDAVLTTSTNNFNNTIPESRHGGLVSITWRDVSTSSENPVSLGTEETIPNSTTFNKYITVVNQQNKPMPVDVRFYRHASNETEAAKGRLLQYTHKVPAHSSRTYLFSNFYVNGSGINPVQMLGYTDDKTNGKVIGVFGGANNYHYFYPTDNVTFKYGTITGSWQDGTTNLVTSLDTLVHGQTYRIKGIGLNNNYLDYIGSDSIYSESDNNFDGAASVPRVGGQVDITWDKAYSNPPIEVSATGWEETYDGQPHYITVTRPSDTTIMYGTELGIYNLSTNPGYTDVGIYDVYFQVSKADHLPSVGQASVVITEGTSTAPTLADTTYTYDGSAHQINVTSYGSGGVTYYSTSSDRTTWSAWDINKPSRTAVGTTYVKAYVLGDGNHIDSGESDSVALTIEQGEMLADVTASGWNEEYDGSAHGITVTAPSGATIKYGTAAGTYNLNASPTYTNVGTYTVYYQITKTNYRTITDSAQVNITKRELEITADNKSVSYGDAVPTLTYTSNGLVGSEALTGALATTYTQGSAVGSYPITQGTLGTTNGTGTNNYKAANYAITYTQGTITVSTSAMPGVSATGFSGAYDGAAHGITVTAPSGATVTYGTTSGTYNLSSSPTWTDFTNGAQTVYYKVVKSGYDDFTGSATVNITKKTLSITAENKSVTYGDAVPTLTYTSSGLVGTEALTGALATAYTSSSNVGSYDITQGTLGTTAGTGTNKYKPANYTITYTKGTITVGNATMTGISASNYSAAYDGAAHGITVTAPSGATVKYGTASGTYNLTSSPTYTDFTNGAQTVYYQVSKANYTTVTGSKTVTISKKALSITADNKSVSYGDAVPTLTYTSNGLVGTEALTGTLTTTYTQGSAVGSYAITQGTLGTTAGTGTNKFKPTNYTITYTQGTITVSNSAMPDVSVSGYSGTYDGSAHGITVSAPSGATIKYGTASGTYNLDASPTYTDFTNGNKAVYYKITKSGYDDVTGSANVNISKKALTITAADKSVSYGDAVPTLTYTSNGLVGSEALTGALTTTYTSSSSVGSYPITQGTLGTTAGTGTNKYKPDNYAITFNQGTITVSNASMSVSATSYNKAYDGSAHGITVTAPSGSTITYGTTSGTYNQSSSPTWTDYTGGNQTVYYKVTKSGYDDVTGSATVNITKASLSITAENKSVTYGDAVPTLTYTSNGLVGTETLTGALATTYTNTSSTGSYAITQGTLGTTAGTGTNKFKPANYAITYTQGTITVGSATMTGISASNYSATYDGAAHGITVTAPSGATVKYGTASGTYNLDASPTWTDFTNGAQTVYYQVSKANYTTVTGSKTVTITKKALSITADNKSVSYGDAVPTLTYTSDGLISGETLTGALTTTYTNTSAVGSYPITQGTLGTTAGTGTNKFKPTNYTITYTQGTITVSNSAMPGVSVSGYSGTYDGSAHGITVTAPSGATVKYGTASGTYNLDASPTYTDFTNGNTPVYYKITKSGYDDVTGSANVNITKKALTITAADKSVTYGDAVPTLTYTSNGLVGSEALTGALTTTYTNTSNVGSYDITQGTLGTTTGTGTNKYKPANYTITYTKGTITVGNATMTGISASNYSAAYDGAAHGITVTAPSGATVKYGTTSGTYNQTSSPTWTDFTNGAQTVYYEVTKANYTTVTGSKTVTITKKALTITAEDKSISYGAAVPTLTYTSSGLVGTEALTGALTTTYTQGSAVGAYPITQGTLGTTAGTGTNNYNPNNYTITFNQGTITVGKAAGSISYGTASVTKTYGDGNFTNTLTKTGDGTVTYSSNNTSVATVNSSSGEVTIVGAGTATITATVSDSTNYTYVTKTATYTLTVIQESYNYINVNTGAGYNTLSSALSSVASNQTIKVIGNNLTETSPTLPYAKKDVKLDMNGKTITLSGGITISNYSGLDIYSSENGAVLQSSVAGNVISNNGNLTINATDSTHTLTIQNTSTSSSACIITNAASMNATINANATLTFTKAASGSSRYLIKNDGTLVINGANLTSNYGGGVTLSDAAATIEVKSGTIDVSGTAIYNGLSTSNNAIVIKDEGTKTEIKSSSYAINSRATGGPNTGIKVSGGTVESTGESAIYSVAGIINISQPEGSTTNIKGPQGVELAIGSVHITGGNIIATNGSGVAKYGSFRYNRYIFCKWR